MRGLLVGTAAFALFAGQAQAAIPYKPTVTARVVASTIKLSFVQNCTKSTAEVTTLVAPNPNEYMFPETLGLCDFAPRHRNTTVDPFPTGLTPLDPYLVVKWDYSVSPPAAIIERNDFISGLITVKWKRKVLKTFRFVATWQIDGSPSSRAPA